MENTEMNELIEKYLNLERELLKLRETPGYDEAAEDKLLEQMDVAWWKLSEDEQKQLNSRPRVAGPE